MASRGPTFMSSRGRRSDERRRQVTVWGLRLAAVGVAFGLGVALGQALDDNPEPGRTQTSVRTFQPLTLPPETVTVTTPAP